MLAANEERGAGRGRGGNLWWMLPICTGQGLGATAGIAVRLCLTGNGSEGRCIYI